MNNEAFNDVMAEIARIMAELDVAPTPLPPIDWSTGQDATDAAHDHVRDLRKNGDA